MLAINELDFWDILSCGLVEGAIKETHLGGFRFFAKGFWLKYRASDDNDSAYRIYREWQMHDSSPLDGFINSRPGKEECVWILGEIVRKRKEVLKQCEK